MGKPHFTTSIWNPYGSPKAPPPDPLLPCGLSQDLPPVRYADYFSALESALTSHGMQALREALGSAWGAAVKPEEIDRVHVESVKHGAFYHVARMEVAVGSQRISLAMNSAFTPHRQAVMHRELKALDRVSAGPGAPFFPRCHYQGQYPCVDVNEKVHRVSYFLAQWFDGYHEFHLRDAPGAQNLHVWDGSPDGILLGGREAAAVFREGARILTLCLDRATFEQVYPWHHAAGDMVVRCGGRAPRLRVISARDYRAIVPGGQEAHERLAAIMSFFYVLTLRLRLDRHEGTGRLLWADGVWVPAMVEGFWKGWVEGQPRSLDSETGALREALLGFSAQDWAVFGEYLLDDLIVDPEEAAFIASKLGEHGKDLARSLEDQLRLGPQKEKGCGS
ncbi:hypothetical protein SAMN02746041_02825 [Desulfacinum hydrothermale DSM 13146]|uniref:Uncharacterized protein n=1 Tax=Desulfacinum hydrothermale DSM 13146 TaxID=1121390 RepID=A0A1W1XSM8_9BACT|nr:hypothetical protein [Desulfacinum hydrothermale]SMC26963.1 hypothetical protein SAMN02746041_02825 [Desulfacinum hydrothermale DSM 13146]